MKKPNWKEIRNYAGQIFTGLIILALISYLFVGIGFKPHFDNEFWTLFGINFAIMLSMTTIWYPISKQKEELKNKKYKKERLEYSILVKRVNDTCNFKGLKSFCGKATETNKNDAIKYKLSKRNIDFDLYEKYKDNVVEVVNEPSLDDKQKKHLIKIIRDGVSFRFLFWRFNGYETINHNSVITAIDKTKSTYDTTNEEKAFDKKVYFAKIATSILISIGFAMIVFTGRGFSLAKLAQIITWIGLIAWNVFTAIENGRKSIDIHRTNFFKKLRGFLEEFCASDDYDKTIEWTRPAIKEEEGEAKNSE